MEVEICVLGSVPFCWRLLFSCNRNVSPINSRRPFINRRFETGNPDVRVIICETRQCLLQRDKHVSHKILLKATLSTFEDLYDIYEGNLVSIVIYKLLKKLLVKVTSISEMVTLK